MTASSRSTPEIENPPSSTAGNRLRVVETWDELRSRPITPDELHFRASLVRLLANSPAGMVEMLVTLLPWFHPWTEHRFWKDGVWTCHVDESTGMFTSQRQAFLAFHTDMSRYRDPPMYTVIRCVRPDPTGGVNLLIHIDDVVERLRSLGRHDILEVLFQPRSLNLAEGDRPLVPLVPRDDPRGVTRVFDRHAADKASHLELDDMEGALFDEFIHLCQDWKDLHVVAHLRAGEILAFSNHRFLHARTECCADGRKTEVCLGNA